jgi:hypothetical protein
MKKMIIVFASVLVFMPSYGQQKPELAKLIKQEVVDGKKICHYVDKSLSLIHI